MTPRATLGLLVHADKALDLVRTAQRLGILARLDAGPATLRELADSANARVVRMYKFLDGLESLGLVTREQLDDDLRNTRYLATVPLVQTYETVLGESSIERDRDRYPWREIHDRLPEVLTGSLDARFAWPPETADDIAGFERSMALGCPPIIEALRAADIFTARDRWLDVGGGDGTVVAALIDAVPGLRGDVLNLPAVESLVRARGVGFVAADFLTDPLPAGYDVLSFIRVLHDWPPEVARMLLERARDALAPGGRIVICEEFRNPDRLAVQFFWTYFLVGVDACVSRLREIEWYRDALERLGFAEISIREGAFDLLTATRI